MKRIFSLADLLMFIIGFAVAMLVFTSCSKPDVARNDIDSDPGTPKIEFRFNGELKQYFDISAGSSRTSGVKYYTFVGMKNPQGNNVFSMTILTDSLQAGTYSMNTGVVSFQEGTTIAMNVTNDFTVTITSNVNGLINGTFTGSLKNYTTSTTSSCLNGKIENVQLIYR